MQKDEYYMSMAIKLAQKGRGWTNPNPMVGAVIVKDAVILGEGYHQRFGGAHAEVEAIKQAYQNGCQNLIGATIYVTLEPCSHFGKTPPCVDRIIQEGFSRVVIGMIDPNPLVCGQGIQKLKKQGIEVLVGVLNQDCERLNEIFLYGIKNQISCVHYKTAMTLDGKIRTVAKQSQWISCEESRREVQEMRSIHKGILVGVQTVCEDDPKLTCRLDSCRQPVRIIVDSTLRIPQMSYVVQSAKEYPTLIATLKSPDQYPDWMKDAGVELITVREKNGTCDLRHLMEKTYKMGIDSILLEGGPTLAASAFEEGIVCFFTGYYAPLFFGGEAAIGPIGGNGVNQIKEAYQLEEMKVSFCGKDLKVEGKVKYPDVYWNH